MATSSNPRLSVLTIVRDEQDVLAETLQSAKSIADELVVVDTGSIDRTLPIATDLGARVVTIPWRDDFAAARNRAIEEATGDWLLWLDAGERLDAESAAQLRNFLQRQADPKKVFAVMVEVPPAADGASSERAAQIRLHPRATELRFEGRVRETLQPSVAAAGMTVELALGTILCHPRRNDPQRKVQRAKRNLGIVAAEQAETGAVPVRLLLAAGEAFSDLGDQESGRRAFSQAVLASHAGSVEMLEAYYGLLTTYELDPEKKQEQLALCVKAVEAFPQDTQLLCVLGNCLQLQGRIDLAARAFETAVRHGRIDLRTWHLTEIVEVAAVCLSLILQVQKKDGEALGVLRDARRRRPSSVRLRYHAIDLCIKHGLEEEALEATAGLPVADEQREPLQSAIRGACAAVRREWTPALAHLQSAYLAGCEAPLCLRWLSVVLLARQQLQAVVPVLERWLAIDPENVEARKYLEAVQAEPAAADAVPDEDEPGRQIRIDQGQPQAGSPLPAPLTTPLASLPTGLQPPAMS